MRHVNGKAAFIHLPGEHWPDATMAAGPVLNSDRSVGGPRRRNFT